MVDVIERVSDFGGEADGGGSDDDNRKKQPSLDDLFLSSSFDEEDGDEEDGVDDEKEDNSGLASDADANQRRKKGDNKHRADHADRTSTSNKRRTVAAASRPSKKTRGPTYSTNERKYLLHLLVEQKPISKLEWQAVAARVNRLFSGGRDVQSIKKQYRSLARKSKDAPSAEERELGRLARAARDQIAQRSAIARDNEYNEAESERFSDDPPEHGDNFSREEENEASNNENGNSVNRPPSPLRKSRNDKRENLRKKREHRRRFQSKNDKNRKPQTGKPQTAYDVILGMVNNSKQENQMAAMAMMMMAAVAGAALDRFMPPQGPAQARQPFPIPFAMQPAPNNEEGDAVLNESDRESKNEDDRESNEEDSDSTEEQKGDDH